VRVADYIGVNYYSRDMVAFDARRPKELFMRRFAKPDAPFSMEGWGEVYAEGLYRVLKRAAAWQLPLYVTEFGVPDNTDALRPRYIVEHVAAMHRALQEGVDLRGAYFWSLVDNWEWAAGWKARFGLLGLDPLTQERTVRGSSDVYLRICKSNGLERSQVHHYAPELASKLWGTG
jgi:beta-glucosidase